MEKSKKVRNVIIFVILTALAIAFVYPIFFVVLNSF